MPGDKEITPEALLSDAVESGLGCGLALGHFADRESDPPPVVHRENLRGLLPWREFTAPHSELAMHVGAAGKPLLAWVISRDGAYAAIAYEKAPGHCATTDGLPTEVLPHEVLKLHDKMFHTKTMP